MEHPIIKYLFVGMLIISLTSCYYDNEEDLYASPSNCDTTNISYKAHIEPVIKQNCITCHGNNTYLTAGGGINLDGYQNLSSFIQSNPDRFTGSIEQNGNYSPMPKGGNKLDDCTLQKINVWISQNLPNN